MNTIDIIALVFILFIVGILLLLCIEVATMKEITIVERPCIDGQGGEFLNQTCKDRIECGIFARKFRLDGCYPLCILKDKSSEGEQK